MSVSAIRNGSNGRSSTRLPAAKARSRVPAPTASSTDAPPKRLASTMPASAGVSAKASFSVARICTPEIHATTSTGRAIAACATGVAGLAAARANQKRERPRRVSGFAVPISRRPSSGERRRSALSATRAAGAGRSAARPPSAISTLAPVSSGWRTRRSGRASGRLSAPSRASCVAISTALAPSSSRSLSRSQSAATRASSRPPLGSSSRRTSGAAARVTTIASRRRSPSESRPGDESRR